MVVTAKFKIEISLNSHRDATQSALQLTKVSLVLQVFHYSILLGLKAEILKENNKSTAIGLQ